MFVDCTTLLLFRRRARRSAALFHRKGPMRLHFFATRFCFDNDTAFIAQLLRRLIRNRVGFGIERRRDHAQPAHSHANGAGIDRTKGGQVRTDQGQRITNRLSIGWFAGDVGGSDLRDRDGKGRPELSAPNKKSQSRTVW